MVGEVSEVSDLLSPPLSSCTTLCAIASDEPTKGAHAYGYREEDVGSLTSLTSPTFLAFRDLLLHRGKLVFPLQFPPCVDHHARLAHLPQPVSCVAIADSDV